MSFSEAQFVQFQRAVGDAGELAAEHFGRHLDVDTKADGSPVSEADKAIDEFLRVQLGAIDPRCAYVSEESPWLQPNAPESYWLVDPIDGTKEFIRSIPEFSIAASRIERGVVQASAVLNPIRKASGFVYQQDSPLLSIDPIPQVDVVVSHREQDCGLGEALDRSPLSVQPVGSVAYRLLLVAAGVAKATVSLWPKNIWDIAAGLHLCRSQGLTGASGLGTDALPVHPNRTFPYVLCGDRIVLDSLHTHLAQAPF